MISFDAHGWKPRSGPMDSVGLMDEAFADARADPRFGLPAWAHEADLDEVRARPIVIFGYNEFSYALLTSIDHARILALVDDHRKGEHVMGVPCITSDEFCERYAGSRDVLCIDCARYGRATIHFRGLARRGDAQVVTFEQAVRMLRPSTLDYRVADHLPALLASEAKIRALEARLSDDLSRETLRRVVLYHLTTCRDCYRPIERPYETLYFRSGLFDPRRDERFVDCGASIGESISGLLEMTDFAIDRAWLIEPDRNNIATLRKLMDKLSRDVPALRDRLALVPAAVGERAGRAAFRHAGGHGGNVVPGAPTDDDLIADVDVLAIDDVVDAPPTFIKMDVEGFELPALRGAAQSIAEHRPRLCVSAYHRPTDLVELSTYVLDLRSDYEVGLRHHTPLRWDTCLYFH